MHGTVLCTSIAQSVSPSVKSNVLLMNFCISGIIENENVGM